MDLLRLYYTSVFFFEEYVVYLTLTFYEHQNNTIALIFEHGNELFKYILLVLKKLIE